MSHSTFYRQFEDRHRGDRIAIKERLKVYLDFVLPLQQRDDAFKALDLGCGRGEWLELMVEQGIDALGIDTDSEMLTACTELGLNTRQEDALSALRSTEENSLNLLTAFHLVEHLPFEDLLTLVTESHRVLKPGGLLILETPNPENLVVAGHSFYVDPTHQRPLPPVLLDFTTEFSGFKRHRILRVQENEQLRTSDRVEFWDVMGGASPDYAILAQKNGPVALIQCLNEAFAREKGLTPDKIARRYDHGVSERFDRLHRDLQSVDERVIKTDQYLAALKLETRLETIHQRFESTQHQIHQMQDHIARERRLAIAETQLEEREKAFARERELQEAYYREFEAATAQELERKEAYVRNLEAATAQEHERKEAYARSLEVVIAQEKAHHSAYTQSLEAQIAAHKENAEAWHQQFLTLRNSNSWRLTKPFRWSRRLLGSLFRGLNLLVLGILSTLLLIPFVPFLPVFLLMIPWILRRPDLRDRLAQRLYRFPLLHRVLHFAARKFGLIQSGPKPTEEVHEPELKTLQPDLPTTEASEPHLSTRAKVLHRRLRQTLDERDRST